MHDFALQSLECGTRTDQLQCEERVDTFLMATVQGHVAISSSVHQIAVVAHTQLTPTATKTITITV